ncbi:hypothetical protein LSAT2_027157 [Lamellibrachia satsuma]|nr:hypothetical protein LSAT2_027157 [Lamellibrachia satsuma]
MPHVTKLAKYVERPLCVVDCSVLTTPGSVKVSGRKRRRVVWVEERAGHVGSQSVDASARLHRTQLEASPWRHERGNCCLW